MGEGVISLPVRAVVDDVNPKNLGWWVIESPPVARGLVGERWCQGLPESAARQIADALNGHRSVQADLRTALEDLNDYRQRMRLVDEQRANAEKRHVVELHAARLAALREARFCAETTRAAGLKDCLKLIDDLIAAEGA